jgi:ELWxxDGT repeat protein
MIPRRRAFRPWQILLPSLALAITGTSGQAHAQDQTARLVKDANRSPAAHGPALNWISPAGKGAVFTMDTLEHGPELWTTNGTPKGTRLLKEFIPGPTGIQISSPTTFGPGDAIKTALTYRDPILGKDVWVTDGTEAGTVCVHQPPSPRSTYTSAGTTLGFFFTEYTYHEWPSEEPQLEKVFFSDGTPAGTHELNPTTGAITHAGVHFVDGPWAYLAANQREIWRSDGTAAGTTRLATSPDEDGSAWPIGIIDGRLTVVLDSPSRGSELWTCPRDGGELTRIATPTAGTPRSLWGWTQVGSRICFNGGDENGELRVWLTDGTAAGTREIELPFEEGEHATYLASVVPWRDSIYLSVSNRHSYDYGNFLFRANADGTGATRIGTFPEGVQLLPAADWREAEPYFYFQAAKGFEQWELWRTRDDVASTRLAKEVPAAHYLRASMESLADTPAGKIFATVADIPWNASQPLYRQRGKHGSAQRLTKQEKWNASGAAYFYYHDVPTYEMTGKHLLEFVDTGRGHELWHMNPDGTGARALWSPPKPLDPSGGALTFRGTTPGGAIFFYYDYNYEDHSSASQLWTSDGTRPGTRLLYDHGEEARNGAGLPENFVQVGDTLFYTVAEHGDALGTGYYLWKTDGTRDGTSRVWGENSGFLQAEPGEMVSFQGLLYFLTRGINNRSMLWRSDGTPGGTWSVAYFRKSEIYATGARGLCVVGGKLLCFANTATYHQLWESNGTTYGTHVIDSPVHFWDYGLDRPIDLGGLAIFRAREEETNFVHQWWCFDETNGIRPLRDGVTADEFPPPHHTGSDEWERLHAATDTKLFYATRDGEQYQLWVTDGTAAGTRPLLKTYSTSLPLDLIAVGDVVYFVNYTETHGTELWRSDGTEAGTVLAADINPGQASSSPARFKLMNGKLYFTAERRDVGRELFVIDLPQH